MSGDEIDTLNASSPWHEGSATGKWKEVRMMTARTVAACAFAMTIVSNRLDAQDLSRYRMFELGTDVAALSALTGVPASEATIVHQRPILLQDLAWRPSRWTPGSNSDSTDPVEQVRFSFYNDHLFRIVVDYGHDRTEGMTDADMVEAISAVYGPNVKPSVKPTRARSESSHRSKLNQDRRLRAGEIRNTRSCSIEHRRTAKAFD
jgi:hypothetical protein